MSREEITLKTLEILSQVEANSIAGYRLNSSYTSVGNAPFILLILGGLVVYTLIFLLFMREIYIL